MLQLQRALEPDGFNATGVIQRARYDAHAPEPLRAERIHPATRSIVVVASGGRALWPRFLAYLAEDPLGRLATRADPLDDYCAAVFRQLGPLLDGCRVVHPTLQSRPHLDFMKLGELAGLGRPSELGILVSARFGPWFALRAAVFAPHDHDGSECENATRSCDGCPAPCRSACPARTVGPAFEWSRCIAERARAQSPCVSRCGAREACIVAPDERYDPAQREYHYDRIAGRRALCARFGVLDALAR